MKPLRLSFISIHPHFLSAYTQFGVFQSALKRNLAEFNIIDLRQYAVDKHGSIDAPPYGGGDGMVMRPEPLRDAIAAMPEKPHVIFTTPGAKKFTQQDAARLVQLNKPICFIAGRFAGVDQRFIDQYVDEEFSLGDFVISGGELPILMIADAMLRLVPGVLGHAESATEDSFAEGMGGGLEYPSYTRPPVFEGVEVPPVLLSGDHAAIKKWREKAAYERTKLKRPDLLTSKE